MFDKVFELFIQTLLVILGLALVFLLFVIVKYLFIEQPKCAIGHYEQRYGLQYVGKTPIQTTYKAYICDVYESEQ